MREMALETKDNLFTLNNIMYYQADMTIETDNDNVHKNLMELATLRFDRIDENVYIYLIDGKFIQVNGTKKANNK
jgi:hypothetical protein